MTESSERGGQTLADHHTPRRRRGRGKALAGAAAVVLAVAAAVVATVGFGGGQGGTQASADLPPATTQVTKQTMYDTESVTGDLGYGPTTSLGARSPGTFTSLPISGNIIKRGGTIYRVDDHPVVLMYGKVPAYRALGSGDEGADVKQLEQNLKALGYTGFTVDEEFTASTADAVKQWQEDLGLAETGRIELGQIVFARSAVRVDSVTAGLGQPAVPGQEALAYTGTSRLVTARLDVADQRLAKKNAKVEVELPDGKRVAGVVQSVATVIEQGEEPQGGTETKIEVIVSLSDAKAAQGLDVASVKVIFTADTRKDVLSVPVAALLALAEGGHGVEVVQGTTSHYVRVETGLFADGRVEISGDGITEGTTVGIPR